MGVALLFLIREVPCSDMREVLRDCPQVLQENGGIVPQAKQGPLPSVSFPTRHPVTRCKGTERFVK
jgi:hypothetical protein